MEPAYIYKYAHGSEAKKQKQKIYIYLAVTPEAQRGFCRGRQLSLNVVDLDTMSRAFNICANIDLTEEHREQQYKGNISHL